MNSERVGVSDKIRFKLQMTIPNNDTPKDDPVISIIMDSPEDSSQSEANYEITLDDLFGQVAESYRHDSSALHRFSYYLLLQAKAFAQDDNQLQQERGTVSIVKE